jgi:hypothetical protein
MSPKFSEDQRRELITRYQQLPSDQAVDILSSPLRIEQNGCPTQVFHLDEAVIFPRLNPQRSGDVIYQTGTIRLFVQRRDDQIGATISAIVFADDGRTFRIPVRSLQKIERPTTPRTEDRS